VALQAADRGMRHRADQSLTRQTKANGTETRSPPAAASAEVALWEDSRLLAGPDRRGGAARAVHQPSAHLQLGVLYQAWRARVWMEPTARREEYMTETA
jgi:hypothetical protein